jgi:hypothetical protein
MDSFMLQADEAHTRRFLNTIFKHCAGIEGWFTLRAFEHAREGRPPVVNKWVPFDRNLVSETVAVATLVANLTGEDRAVFSPPVAIFGNELNKKGDNRFAGESNVVAAPALAAELDKNPQAALAALVEILGEPTILVASGGMWEGQPKLHAYWRLGEPARSREDLAALKHARRVAAKLAGADHTGITISHPMRMPGSWHTKGEPRLCEVIGGSPARDIKLSWAVEELERAAEAAGVEIDRRTSAARENGEGFKTEKAWSREDLMRAAELIPNDERVEWDGWSNTLMAFYDASHGSVDGLDAGTFWSEKNPKGDADAVAYKWDHISRYPPKDISAGTLVKLARGVDPDFLPGKVKPEEWFDQDEASNPENDVPPPPEKLPNRFEEIQQKAAKFVFEPFYDAAATALTTAAAPLIKGLLDQGAMSVVYGQSNVGKTFLTVDIGYHIATGLSYAGMKTTRGHVIYLSAEGGRSITKRLSALCMKYGTTADVDFHLLRSSIDLRRPDADLVPLIYAIKSLGVPVSLIVVDTLSRALAGGDENSSVDMGQIVTNFDKLREHTNAHLMVVHHSGKNQAAGARGHSLLRAATDTEIEVSEGVIAAKKQRDLDKNWSSPFTLDVHTLGVDADGDPVTSCSVRLISHAEATAVQVEALTPSEAIVAAAVAELDAFNEDENEGVGASELIDFLAGKLEDISQNSVRQLLKRGVQKGALTKCRRGRWKSANLQSGQTSGQSVFS